MFVNPTPSIWIMGSPFKNETQDAVIKIKEKGWQVEVREGVFPPVTEGALSPTVLLVDGDLSTSTVKEIFLYWKLLRRQPKVFLVSEKKEMFPEWVTPLDSRIGVEGILSKVFSEVPKDSKTKNSILDVAENCTVTLETSARTLVESGLPSIVPSRFLSDGHLTVQEALKIQVGFEEALINAIEHGCLKLDSNLKEQLDESGNSLYEEERFKRLSSSLGERKVKIRLKLENSRLQIKITDSGDGFLLKEGQEKDDTKLSGRGLALIKAYFDEVVLNKKGNSISLIKSFRKS